MPLLRKHVREVAESPTPLHLEQVAASIQAIRAALDYLTYYLQTPSPGGIIKHPEET